MPPVVPTLSTSELHDEKVVLFSKFISIPLII